MHHTAPHPMLLAAAFTALITGCASSGWIDAEGVPDERYVMGGGNFVEFVAPEDGVAYLVERNTHTVVGTRSLREGQTFDQHPANGGPEMFEEAVGVPMREARLLLYFVPQDDIDHYRKQAAATRDNRDNAAAAESR